MFDRIYSQAGFGRLSLGMPSPIYAGILFMLAFFVLRALEGEDERSQLRRKLYRIGSLIACVLMGLTGSRTPVVALLVAFTIMFLLEARSSMSSAIAKRLPEIFWSVLALLIGAVVSGTWRRATYGYVVSDPSILNRLDLWRAGLRALSVTTPWGVGENNSSELYANWFAPNGSRVTVQNFSSTILTLILEQGQLTGAIVCAAFLYPLCVLLVRIRYGAQQLYLAAGSIALLICYLSTTLGLSALLYIFTMVFALWSAVSCGRLCGTRGRLHFSIIASLFIVAGVVFNLGRAFKRGGDPGAKFLFTFREHGEVSLVRSRRAVNSRRLIWLGDPALMESKLVGCYPGMMVRNIIISDDGPSALEFYPTTSALTDIGSLENATVILMGSDRRIPSGANSHYRVVLVCPTSPPTESDTRLPISAIILPEVDQFGCDSRWAEWAGERKIQVVNIPGTGPNIFYECNELAHVLAGL